MRRSPHGLMKPRTRKVRCEDRATSMNQGRTCRQVHQDGDRWGNWCTACSARAVAEHHHSKWCGIGWCRLCGWAARTPKPHAEMRKRRSREYPTDIYGLPIGPTRQRGEGCSCPRDRPCKSFRCVHPHHDGDRRTPWCRGGCPDGVDPRGTWCDTCWGRESDIQKSNLSSITA